MAKTEDEMLDEWWASHFTGNKAIVMLSNIEREEAKKTRSFKFYVLHIRLQECKQQIVKAILGE